MNWYISPNETSRGFGVYIGYDDAMKFGVIFLFLKWNFGFQWIRKPKR